MKQIIATIFMFFSAFALSDEGGKTKYKFDNGVIYYKGDGFYESKYKSSELEYIVDSKARLCFAYIEIKDIGSDAVGWGASMSSIPCENLKKRNEWEKIIAW